MKRVLIVDDSSTMRVMLHDLMEGFSDIRVIGSAKNGLEALAAIDQQKPDIVLIDLVMPYIDGAQLLSKLAGYPAMTKVVISSRTSEELERKLFQLGASAYFDKSTIVGDPTGFHQRLMKLGRSSPSSRAAPRPSSGNVRANVIMAAGRFPVPADEAARLKRLSGLRIANIGVDPCLDIIVRHVAGQVRFPIAAVSLIDADTSWAKATVGFPRGSYARGQTLCAHALCETGPTIVADAANHPVFGKLEMVTGAPKVRSYAGVPITSQDGVTLGVLCVADSRPRHVSAQEIAVLTHAARLVAEFMSTPARAHRLVA